MCPRFTTINFAGFITNFWAIKDAETYGLPYDYESIMHYSGTTFSVNGLNTIDTLDPKYQSVIGQKQLSKLVKNLTYK
jgi:hypothetical protein